MLVTVERGYETVCEDTEQLQLSYLAMILEDNWHTTKAKQKCILDPPTLCPGIFSTLVNTRIQQKAMYKNVQSNFIYNSPGVEIT